jgi:riboflavin synthase
MARRIIGIVDTTFARVDMGAVAIAEIDRISRERGWDAPIVRATVPGFKDLAVEAVRLFDNHNCEICLVMGWVGGMPIDTQCAHEASLAIGAAQLITRRHILEVFVHESESQVLSELHTIAVERASKHALNALDMVFRPESLVERAGTGLRQGGPSVGPIFPK